MERGRERRGTEGAGARVSMGAGRERKGKEFIFLLNHHKFFQEKKRRVTIIFKDLLLETEKQSYTTTILTHFQWLPTWKRSIRMRNAK